jgi:hypothetical protein
MTAVTGSGIYYNLWDAFQGTFTVVSSSPTSFTIIHFATFTITGTGFTYSTTPLPGGATAVALTGGTITGVSTTSNVVNNQGQQTYSGLNISGVAAFNAIANNDQAAFNALFFGGPDTIAWSGQPTGALSGYGGDDTFNISTWGPTPGLGSFSIDGGSGNDTLNITGGVRPAELGFSVLNVETINLGADYDYDISSQSNLVTTGNTLTVDGSTLGAANHLNFRVDSDFNSTTFTGNLVLYGGAGNDFFQGGRGFNFFHGGAGGDTVSFAPGSYEAGRSSYSGPGVTANLSIAGFQNLGGLRGGSAAFDSIENLTGTPWADTLTGDSSDNILDGGAGGADVLSGGAGNDTLIAGGPNSVLNGGDGDDTLKIFGGTVDGGNGVDTVVLSSNFNSAPYLTFTYSGRTVTINSVNFSTVTATNVEFARFNDKTVQISGPAITTADKRVAANQTVALSTLFTVTDLTGDAVTNYQIWDSNAGPASGYFTIGGVPQAAKTILNITAAQLAQVSYVSGTVNDNLQIRAFDSNSWSAADNAAWSPFTVGPTVNKLPVVTGNIGVQRTHFQTVALSSLFSTSDADNDAITKYQLWDSTRDPASGHFVVNGQDKPAGIIIEIAATDLANTSFVTGMVGDNLQIRAFDGLDWSAGDNAAWAPASISVPPNSAPTINNWDLNAGTNQTIALSSLLSSLNVHDNDGDTITRYQLWDSSRDPLSGNWVVNGVTQAPGTVVDITAAQVGQTSFVTNRVSDSLQIRAYDGIAWSAADNAYWAPFTLAVPNALPVVITTNLHVAANQTLALSSLVSVSDADGDAITRYQLWDGSRDPASGHFVVNGTPQAAGTVIDITAAQAAQTFFVAGSNASDALQIRAFDGISWSDADTAAWSPFTVSPPINNAPVVSTSNVQKPHLQSFALSSLFSVSDIDGDSMTKYQLWDANRDPSSGHFVVNSVDQAAGTIIEITAAQLGQTFFKTGIVGDQLQIRAFDGASWSAADNAAWATFNVTVPANSPPVLIPGIILPHHNEISSLNLNFNVGDNDGDAITKYQLWDSTRDPASGHFAINGVAQPAGTVIDITAAQLSQMTFVAGTVNDSLQIRAYDGIAWSAADNAAWTSFNVLVLPNSAPVVNTQDVAATAGQNLLPASLFQVGDNDSDTMTRYQLWDSTNDPNSGHFVVNGAARAASTIIDITAAQLAQTSFLAGTVGDSLQIRAFDGFAWSAADNAAWSPFHINV